MYRERSAATGKPLNSRDIDKHPRLSQRAADRAVTGRGERVRRGAGIGKETRVRSKPSGTGAAKSRASGAPAGRAPSRVRTLSQWDDHYDDYDDYEDVTLEAGVDTGKGKE